MQCFIHVGITRTAEGFLQKFLSLNLSELINQKLMYVNFLDPKDLLFLANSYPKKTFSFLKMNNIYQVDEYKYKEILIKLRGFKSIFNSESFLLSSQYLHSEIYSVKDLEVLRNRLKKIGFKDIKIIIYLRDPLGLASALFSSLTREGVYISNIPNPYEDTDQARYFNFLCDHRKTLERFTSAFGRENLIVRIFNKDSLKNQSILEDFLDIFDIAWNQDFTIPKSERKALSNLGPEILGRINKRIPTTDSLTRIKLRKLLLSSFDDLFTNENYNLSPNLHHFYEEAFAESNEWVRQKFFPERELLFPKRPLPKAFDHGFTEQELDNIANLLADLWLEQEQGLS